MKPTLALLFFLANSLSATAAQDPAIATAEAQPRGLILREPEAFDGYTLFAPLQSGTIFLVDMQGEVVHTWDHGLPPIAVYLLDNGHLVVSSRIDETPVFFGGGLGGRVRELDWDGKVLWDWVLSNEERVTHHDIEPLPNGRFLAILWEHVKADQAIALGRDPEAVGEPGWWPDAVVEVEPVRPDGARIVWEWRMADHLIQDLDRSKPDYGSLSEHPGRLDVNFDLREREPLSAAERRELKERERMLRELGYAGGDEPDEGADAGADDPREDARRDGDWTHTNSVDYHAELDLILLSSPSLDEIFVIDHSTTSEQARGRTGGRYGKGGDLLYRWGNPRNWGAGSDADRRLFGQHQPEWITPGCPGAGHVLLFNNGEGRAPIEHSTVEELVLPFEPGKGFLREAGKPLGPAAPLWSYAAPEVEDFYSFFISGCQRLPNGNTLICSGQQGRFLEVTADGRIVWEYWNPHGGELVTKSRRAKPGPSPVQPKSVFRATRLAPDHPGLAGRDLDSGAKR